jgi:hypothetical protein
MVGYVERLLQRRQKLLLDVVKYARHPLPFLLLDPAVEKGEAFRVVSGRDAPDSPANSWTKGASNSPFAGQVVIADYAGKTTE